MLTAIVAALEPSLKVDIEVKKVPQKVNAEDVRKLFVEYYGEREGEELFKFELYQLIVSGKTVEEALAELWERLTSTKISSERAEVRGEHVGLRRKDEGTQDSNQARHNG